MAGRDIVTNLIANDKASKAIEKVGDAADKSAGQVEKLTVAEERSVLAAEKAQVRVEKTTQALTRAQERYGRESEQARDASHRLRAAQLDLADAEEKLTRRAREAANATQDNGSHLQRMLGPLSSLLHPLDAMSGGFHLGALRLVGFGAAAAGAVGPAALLGARVLTLGARVVAFGAEAGHMAIAMAPALASLPALAGGFAFAKATITASAPGIVAGVKPITDRFELLQGHLEHIAGRGLPELSRAFLRANFPTISDAMTRIATATNGVVRQVGRWLTTADGIKAVRVVTEGTANLIETMAPKVGTLATKFGRLVGAAGPGAFDHLNAILGPVTDKIGTFLDSITRQDINQAWAKIDTIAGEIPQAGKAIEGFTGKFSGLGHAIVDVGTWMADNRPKVKAFSDTLSGLALVLGVIFLNPVTIVLSALTLLTNHWSDLKRIADESLGSFRSSGAEAKTMTVLTKAWSDAVSGLVGWFREWLMPAMRQLGRVVMPQLRDAWDDLSQALKTVGADTAFWTGLAKILGGILIGVIVVAVVSVVATIRVLSQVIRAAAAVLHAFAVGFMALRDGVETAGNAVHDWFHNLPRMMSGAVGSLGSLLTQAGRDSVNGMLNGARDAFKSVASWAGDLKEAVVGAVKHVFGIHSPSRVMMGLGGHLVDGLIHGIVAKNPGQLITDVFGGTTQALGAMLSSGLIGASRLTGKAIDALGSAFGPGPSLAGRASGHGANRALGRSLAAGYGWTGGQWNALDQLWMGESGWNERAKNPTSTAFGIPQFLASTAGAYGLAYGSTNPAAQITAGLKYIRDVYGSPAAAYGAWSSRSPHWYANGGVIREPVMGVGLRSGDTYGFGERGPETVVPGAHTPSRVQAGGGTTVIVQASFAVDAPNYVGDRRELVQALVKEQQSGGLDVITRRLAEDVASRVRR